ncbi:TPA: DUF4393 domain-containing protein [Vibrio cholerae]|nr:DUF4393 domain-containing protein [Vibrio cholerae]
MKNLERLGLIDIQRDKGLVAYGVYDRILNDPEVKVMEVKVNGIKEHRAQFEKYFASVSSLGDLFIAACVNSRDKT